MIQIILVGNFSLAQNLDFMLEEFAGADYQLFSCQTAEEGLQLIRNHNPELVIAEEKLSDFSGAQLLNRAKGFNKSVRTILLKDEGMEAAHGA
jgi:two-component SAPR family response regulator